MIHTYKSTSGKTTISITRRSGNKVYYIILPNPLEASELESLADRFSSSIVVLSGLDWNDDLTPWPSSKVSGLTGVFKGDSKAFNEYIVTDVIPRVEQILGIQNPSRTLIGISLSGLFALWQWAQDDSFENIISLSGSFWYDGFVEWVKATYSDQALSSRKNGSAYFFLGSKEGKSGPKEFSTVRSDTETIVNTLSENNIHSALLIVEGGHHSPVYPRLVAAMSFAAGEN